MSGSSGNRLSPSHRGEQICEVRCTVHDRLIGGVVADVVVIDDEPSVEIGVLVRVVKADAEKVLVYGSVNRTIYQSTGELNLQILGDYRMRIARKVARLRKPDDHRHAPWICAEQP